MNGNELCVSIKQLLPPAFVCSLTLQESVRVRTPMLYPDGTVVDVFILEHDGKFTITDFGDALSWLELQSTSRRRSSRQQALVDDICQTLGIQLLHDQLILHEVERDALEDAVFRIAQSVVRVSDLWFTLRNQSIQTTADEVDEWLNRKQIPFQRQTKRSGRSMRTWNIDFETRVGGLTSLVFLLSTGSRAASRRIAEHVVAGCVDLSHQIDDPNLSVVSLFDDTSDVWHVEDFRLVEMNSKVALWSDPDELQRILAPL